MKRTRSLGLAGIVLQVPVAAIYGQGLELSDVVAGEYGTPLTLSPMFAGVYWGVKMKGDLVYGHDAYFMAR